MAGKTPPLLDLPTLPAGSSLDPQAPNQAPKIVRSPAVPDRQSNDDDLRAARSPKASNISEQLPHLVLDV